ncbi:helix-turn-helix transcriptional regulator [Aquimarina litoralis]|uniref:helix-turn-helix transcriptional regulator n=1 Tax=Aquimarina litoralis TaxID=584605 RepID=UPI001C58BA19|nr:AraC family transcriptional regulator [Aquimarina litoralis]MBW1294980.1 helix-turn-helix domain-containing protein [Aquimarina litoralis]
MIQLEEITSIPTFSSQLENKILYSDHSDTISVQYQSTYTIKYVMDGVKRYHVNNQDLKVSKYEYLILNNSQIITEAKKGTKGLSLFLSPTLMDEISHFYFGHHDPVKFLEVIQKNANQKVKNVLDTLVYLYHNDKIGLHQQMEDLFMTISELIIQEQVSIDDNFKKLKIVRHNTKRALYKSITETKEYLNDNFSDKISLESISKDIGISKYYLHRLFKEIHGSTPLEYVTAIRIANAKNKLQYSKESIFEIAIQSGFDNTAYFSNVFKKHVGLSPTQFRKAI